MGEIKLGTVIKFNKISRVEYEPIELALDCKFGRGKEPRKLIYKDKLAQDFKGMVVGKVKKATGKYAQQLETPNSLIVDKFHDFYEVRTGLKNKSVLVHPDDVVLVEASENTLPNRNDIKYHINQKIYSEGNNGADFFEIEELEPGIIRIKSGSCCVYNHNGVYPTEYLTRLLDYARMNLSPKKLFEGWNKEYVKELMEKIKHE